MCKNPPPLFLGIHEDMVSQTLSRRGYLEVRGKPENGQIDQRHGQITSNLMAIHLKVILAFNKFSIFEIFERNIKIS